MNVRFVPEGDLGLRFGVALSPQSAVLRARRIALQEKTLEGISSVVDCLAFLFKNFRNIFESVAVQVLFMIQELGGGVRMSKRAADTQPRELTRRMALARLGLAAAGAYAAPAVLKLSEARASGGSGGGGGGGGSGGGGGGSGGAQAQGEIGSTPSAPSAPSGSTAESAPSAPTGPSVGFSPFPR